MGMNTLQRMARGSISALIDAGLLEEGTEVFHEGRLHSERTAAGRIVAGGIKIGDRVHASPSGAARAVSGSSAENGWRWWRVRPSGLTLDEIRQKMLLTSADTD